MEIVFGYSWKTFFQALPRFGDLSVTEWFLVQIFKSSYFAIICSYLKAILCMLFLTERDSTLINFSTLLAYLFYP